MEIPSPLPTSHVAWRSDILTALCQTWNGKIYFQDSADMPSDCQSAHHSETRCHRHGNRVALLDYEAGNARTT